MSLANRNNLLKTAAALAVIFLAARDAPANCQNSATSQSVVAGQNLAEIIERSTPPCTLEVGPGTYDAAVTLETSDLIFRISSGITVRSTAGPASTVLRVPTGKEAAVIIQALNGRCPNGATLDGFTLTGGLWGVLVKAVQTGTCPSDQVRAVTLRNLAINTDSGNPAAGHGIDFFGVQDSVIDSCTINAARVNGIYLNAGSHHNLVMNNTVLSTLAGHAIAVQDSSDNVLVGNTIRGAAFDGILLNSAAGPSLTGAGSSRNRIERNTISGHRYDGITLTDGSRFNYVGMNTIASSSYHPVSKPTPDPTDGVGIWVNNASNGNYLFGNDISGAPENGIDVLTSRSTYIAGNRVHANYHGGLWVANYQFAADPSSPTPQDTVIHHNYVYFNTTNAQINLEGVTNVDLAYNHLAGDDAGTLAGPNTGGVWLHEGGAPTRATLASSAITVYENTVTDVNNRAIVNGTTTSTIFFRNRFLNGANDPNAPLGRQGLTYSYAPADVEWDASRFLGGNHWSEYCCPRGDPDTDPTHWYRRFVYDNAHGIDGNAPYADKFPYESQSLGAPYAPYGVRVLEPVAGSALAAGTRRTIAWLARGCVLVDIYYGSGAAAPTLVASGYPNVGYYAWTVPPAPVREDYYIQVVCLDSHGTATGAVANSDLFTIAAGGLVLLTPGRAFRATNNEPLRVAWTKTSAVTGVDIFIRNADGPEIQLAANATGTFADVTLPSAVWGSSQVRLRIQDAANSARQDSTDGYFMVRGSTPSWTTALSGRVLQIGSVEVLQWNGPWNSYTVDLDLYENGAFARSIVHGLPDFGRFTWLVPEMWSPSSTIRATFKDADGAVISTLDSGIFQVFYSTTPGTLVERYRLYSPVTLEHLFTTDLNEYTVLGTTGVWIQEGVASRMHTGPTNINGVQAVPYYRLYDYIARWHHWTTDRNEYFTLRRISSRYLAEGVDGYIFPAQVPGTVPWYRLLYTGIAGLHHWTADQHERDTLLTRGWIEEHRQYVFPP